MLYEFVNAIARILVGRLTITGRQRQFVDEVVLHDRNLNFAEQLVDVEAAVDGQGRRALTGKIVRLEQRIRIKVQELAPIFIADVDADTIVGPRGLDAEFTELAGEVDVRDLLSRLTADDAEDVQVIDRGSRGAAQKIIGNAVRVGVVEDRATNDRRAGRADRNDVRHWHRR